MARTHWHVHSTIPGYMCSCDWHAALTAAERDDALREEKAYWQDYKADVESCGLFKVRITGSIRAGGFYINDPDSMGWHRAVESWACTAGECIEEEVA